MKDPGHHRKQTQKKVIRETREESKEEPSCPKCNQEDESMPVEIEEQPTVTRSKNRKYH